MDNTFLREAMEHIEELTDSAREPHVVEIAGKTYCDKSMSRYDREEMADPLVLHRKEIEKSYSAWIQIQMVSCSMNIIIRSSS